jgi:hypothetical protein
MTLDPLLAIASFGIGIVVGLTGMGGGALMTPALVLFFNVAPLTAVSSDLVASALMKPVGSFVHLRRGQSTFNSSNGYASAQCPAHSAAYSWHAPSAAARTFRTSSEPHSASLCCSRRPGLR